MSGADPHHHLVIGIGHSYRNDDAVGPVVARALVARGLPAIVHEGEGSGLIDLWAGCASVTVVDAVSGGVPGTIHRLAGNLAHLQTLRFVRSTHDLGLPEAVALGQWLGRMPGTLSVVGIAGSDFSIGERLSAPVRAAADQVISEIARELQDAPVPA